MVGWNHRLNGHDEIEQTPGDGERQGSVRYCSLWSLKELVTTERLNKKNMLKTNKQTAEKARKWILT